MNTSPPRCTGRYARKLHNFCYDPLKILYANSLGRLVKVGTMFVCKIGMYVAPELRKREREMFKKLLIAIMSLGLIWLVAGCGEDGMDEL